MQQHTGRKNWKTTKSIYIHARRKIDTLVFRQFSDAASWKEYFPKVAVYVRNLLVPKRDVENESLIILNKTVFLLSSRIERITTESKKLVLDGMHGREV